MTLNHAFDPQALIDALKANAVPDAEKVITDKTLPIICDWLNSSIALESPVIGKVAQPILEVIETKAIDALKTYWGQAVTPA